MTTGGTAADTLHWKGNDPHERATLDGMCRMIVGLNLVMVFALGLFVVIFAAGVWNGAL